MHLNLHISASNFNNLPKGFGILVFLKKKRKKRLQEFNKGVDIFSELAKISAPRAYMRPAHPRASTISSTPPRLSSWAREEDCLQVQLMRLKSSYCCCTCI
jgi:hypothetical protein